MTTQLKTFHAFISVKETDRPNVVRIAKGYADLGFTLYGTRRKRGQRSVQIFDNPHPHHLLPGRFAAA